MVTELTHLIGARSKKNFMEEVTQVDEQILSKQTFLWFFFFFSVTKKLLIVFLTVWANVASTNFFFWCFQVRKRQKAGVGIHIMDQCDERKGNAAVLCLSSLCSVWTACDSSKQSIRASSRTSINLYHECTRRSTPSLTLPEHFSFQVGRVSFYSEASLPVTFSHFNAQSFSAFSLAPL